MKIDILEIADANLGRELQDAGFEVENISNLGLFRVTGVTSVNYEQERPQYIKIIGCDKHLSVPLRLIRNLMVSVL